ncbi:NACHT, LRR and PYD domains-containing protein 8 [Perognathus longimembris pacificus]|uniref:NACHT, LRR and PYD domains-containing protein 8 n=1 Tax=Perognathus longimembris pacificus TaxID=214514 RepID=UPI0020185A8E|nr:NACHT, LRR and PYD domains-containing protein 8 [Perognathus longimembris pacificus]
MSSFCASPDTGVKMEEVSSHPTHSSTCSPPSPRDHGIMLYMAELNEEDLQAFKQLLASQLSPDISSEQLGRASWAEVVHLLTECFPGRRAWEVTHDIFTTMGQEEMCVLVQEELSGLLLTLEPEKLDPRDAEMELKKEELDKIQEYKLHVREAYSPPWDPTVWPGDQEDFLYQDADQHCRLLPCLLLPQKPRGTQPRTVVVQGAPGIGKTTLAKQVMVAWAQGEFYPHRMRFAFHLRCQELRRLARHSLSGLIRQKCLASRGLVSKVLSRPHQLLFVVDGFEELTFSLPKGLGELSDDYSQRLPGPVLLRSLLSKKMLPEATLLLVLRPTSWSIVGPLLTHPTLVTLTGFSECERIRYFRVYFQDTQQADLAVNFTMENASLFSLCRVPAVCWLVCHCLKEQMRKPAGLAETCPNATSVIALSLSPFFQNWAKTLPRPTRQKHLEGLCQLAARGMWRVRSVFNSQELARASVDEAILAAFLGGNILRPASRGPRFAFTLFIFQEFFAALFYVLSFPQRLQSYRILGRVEVQCLLASPGGSRNSLSLLGLFLFGLLNVACATAVERALGCRLGQGNKNKVLKVVAGLPSSPPQPPCCGVPQIFYCLAEILEDEALRQALGSFQTVPLKISSCEDLRACALSLPRCEDLKGMELSLARSSCSQPGWGPGPSPEDAPRRTDLIHGWWREICSVLGTHEGLEALTVVDSAMEVPFTRELAVALTQPRCRVQRLCLRRVGPGTLHRALFQVLIDNQRLQVLEIENTEVGREAMKALCEVLKSPRCCLRCLKLECCQIADQDWDDLASDLQSNLFLKTLLLRGSSLAEQGVAYLAVGHLEKLALEDCGLTEALGGALALGLKHSKRLTHLSLAGNALKDGAGRLIWKALENLVCPLRRLVLRNCALTSACCPEMTSALKSNKTLRSLDLSCNGLGDTGMGLLCQVLAQPGCHLQVLELEGCLLTSASCPTLATMLHSNRRLQHLDLSQNDIGLEGVLTLNRAFSGRWDIEEVLLHRRVFGQVDVQMRLKGPVAQEGRLKVIQDWYTHNA